MIVEAFQTLEDKDNIDQIELEGPFICDHSGAWLGVGYYLWDSNFDWALDWGEFAYNRYGKQFVVIRCKVDLSKDCFDLVGNVKHQMELLGFMKALEDSGKIKDESQKTIPNLLRLLDRKGYLNYKSIRANDFHKNVVRLKFRFDRKEYMVLNERVQICVLVKKDVILQPIRVVYPEKYLI